MSVMSFEDLELHVGHNLVSLKYQHPGKDFIEVTVECEDCYEVLYSEFKNKNENNKEENPFEIGTVRRG